jgi:ABC-type enterochelin transport system substrate-binding protein
LVIALVVELLIMLWIFFSSTSRQKNTSAFIIRNQNADDVHGRRDCGNHKIMQAPVEEIKLDLRILAAMSFTPTQIAAEIKKHIPEFTITYEPDFVKKYNSWPASIDDAALVKTGDGNMNLI